ncbi:MAG: RluA family pseudouridine synthase [Bacteriovoracia bacterium]
MHKLVPGDWTHLASDAEGTRLDVYLPQKFPELSRARAQKLISEGKVLRNGAPVKANHKLEIGDALSIFLPAAKSSVLRPQDIPLTIYFQDEHLAVIEKPAGLVVHPSVGHAEGTLVNALLHHFPDLSSGSGIGGEQRPGIVHRIDRNTSGILLITKTDLAHRALGEQFKEHSISRRYSGLAWGKLPEKGEWKGNIGRDPKERKRMAIVPEGQGRTALTLYRAVAHFDGLTQFEAELKTGRTHQIRVHFSAHGFPLAGDSVYGAASRLARQQKEKGLRSLLRSCPKAHEQIGILQEISRQFLHACHLGFSHPVSGERLEFDSALPSDLAEIMLSLRECRKP